MTPTPRTLPGALRRAIAVLAITAGLLAGLAVLVTPPADAATVRCAWPRCVVYANRAETVALARGNAGSVVSRIPDLRLRGAFWVSYQAHRWFIGQYARKGLCVKFTLSAVPWESQGLASYRC